MQTKFVRETVGANGHRVLLDGCSACTLKYAEHCKTCHRTLKLRDMKWQILTEESSGAALPAGWSSLFGPAWAPLLLPEAEAGVGGWSAGIALDTSRSAEQQAEAVLAAAGGGGSTRVPCTLKFGTQEAESTVVVGPAVPAPPPQDERGAARAPAAATCLTVRLQLPEVVLLLLPSAPATRAGRPPRRWTPPRRWRGRSSCSVLTAAVHALS